MKGGGLLLALAFAVGGCGTDERICEHHEPGCTRGSIVVAGVERTYELALPDAYSCGKPYPLVFAWHGHGDTGAGARSYFGLDDAFGGSAVIVYPDGLPRQTTAGQTGWDLLPSSDDLLLFDALREKLAREYCVDPGRTFAVGHSRGARFTNSLGCYRPDALRAIAAVAGGGPDGPCDGRVPAWIAHGVKDTTNPVQLGEGSRDFWASENACDSVPTGYEWPLDTCTPYSGCAPGYPVSWCPHTEYSAEYNGHVWPSFAAATIRDFFAAFE